MAPFNDPRKKENREPKEPHRLSDIRVGEVSIVDRAANMRKFFLLKRDGNRTTGLATVSLLNLPLVFGGEPLFPPDLTVGEVMEMDREVRAAAIQKMFDELSVENKVAFLQDVQVMDWELNYALLSKSDKEQVDRIEADYCDPLRDAERTIKLIRRKYEMLSPEDREYFSEHPERFELITPVEKQEPDTREIRYVDMRKNPNPPAPANGAVVPVINVIVNTGTPAKKSIQFQRDAAGNIIGAEQKVIEDTPAPAD